MCDSTSKAELSNVAVRLFLTDRRRPQDSVGHFVEKGVARRRQTPPKKTNENIIGHHDTFTALSIYLKRCPLDIGNSAHTAVEKKKRMQTAETRQRAP